MRNPRFALAALLLSSLSLAQGLPNAGSGPSRALDGDQHEWRPAEGLEKGAQFVKLTEDPAAPASEVLIRLPRGYTVPPHRHTHRETLLVVEGRLYLAEGGHERGYGPGSYIVFPAGRSHSARTSRWKGAVFYARTDGPFDLHPVAP